MSLMIPEVRPDAAVGEHLLIEALCCVIPPQTVEAVSSARSRLGARPLARLFRLVCRPLATPATPGAFGFGLRLLALDGFTLDLADTPSTRGCGPTTRMSGRVGGGCCAP